MHNCGVFPFEEITLDCLATIFLLFFFFGHAVLLLTIDQITEMIS